MPVARCARACWHVKAAPLPQAELGMGSHMLDIKHLLAQVLDLYSAVLIGRTGGP
jgi:hypothetical protein